jgi:fatty-acyl-CoA synthase
MHPYLHAQTFPDKPAYIMASSGETLTYAELDRQSNQAAHLLRSLGIESGDHLALFVENSLQFMAIVWACQRAGVIFTTISTHLKREEVAYIADNCQARIFIGSQKLREVSTSVKPMLPSVEHFYMVGSEGDGFVSWEQSLQGFPTAPIADEARGIPMLYSSGTTGRPKGILPQFEAGVPITEMNPLWSAMTAAFQYNQQTVYLSPAPLYHASPLANNMMVVAAGGTSIIMEKFDAEQCLALIDQYKVTHGQWVPIMFVRMLKLDSAVKDKYRMDSLRMAIHSAAPCPVDIKQQMIDWWGEVIVEFYSSTEAIGATMLNTQQWLAHRGSVGFPVGCMLHILDDTGNELPAGEIGRVYFSSDNPPFEYFNCDEQSTVAYSAQGYATVGDMGYVDEEGYLYLTDRADFMIISGGVNIYPQEIENLLITHERVADVAVFGLPDAEFGESVKAVVQRYHSDDALTEEALAEELAGFCRQHLSNVKCPRSFDFVEELPRFDNGKLYKKGLREAYLRG